MAHLRDIVFDSAHPASLARFWAAALDGYKVAPYDDDETERLRSIGVTDPEDDPTVLVEGPSGSPRFWFQLVPEPKVHKNRVHVDLRADDFDVELARLRALGATLADEQPNADWVVLRDPEGNEFCLLR
jgi:catechol 2,3-dioxygenase-like lactoylglutathione lyase family enzyme